MDSSPTEKRVFNDEDVKSIVQSLLVGKTQRQLALELGISVGKLNDYLRTGIAPSPSLLKAIGMVRVVCYRRAYEDERHEE